MFYDKHKTEILMFVSESLKEIFGGVPKILYDSITLGNIRVELTPHDAGANLSIAIMDVNDRRTERNTLYIAQREPVVTYVMNEKDTGVLHRTLYDKVDTVRVTNRINTNRVITEVIGHMLAIVETGICVKYHTVLNGLENNTIQTKEFGFRDYSITDGTAEDKIIDGFADITLNVHNIVDEIIIRDIVRDPGSSVSIKMDHENAMMSINYLSQPVDTDEVSIYGSKSMNVNIHYLHDDYKVVNIMSMLKSIIENGRNVN